MLWNFNPRHPLTSWENSFYSPVSCFEFLFNFTSKIQNQFVFIIEFTLVSNLVPIVPVDSTRFTAILVVLLGIIIGIYYRP